MSYAFINMDGNYMLELDDEILIEANAVAELERERIIKLLEEYLSAFQAPQEQLMQRRMTDFIALIKGEGE